MRPIRRSVLYAKKYGNFPDGLNYKIINCSHNQLIKNYEK
jgi:hypothetical protein